MPADRAAASNFGRARAGFMEGAARRCTLASVIGPIRGSTCAVPGCSTHGACGRTDGKPCRVIRRTEAYVRPEVQGHIEEVPSAAKSIARAAEQCLWIDETHFRVFSRAEPKGTS